MNKQDNNREDIPYSIESLQQHIKDAKLRLALLEYQQKEDRAWRLRQGALPSDAPQRLEEARYFNQTETRTLRLIKKHERYYAKSTQPRRTSRLLPVVAILILALALSLGTALAVSPELRIHVIRMLYKVTPQYTEVSFSTDSNHFVDVPDDWAGLYYPEFVPEGYHQSEMTSSSKLSKIALVASDRRYLLFAEYNYETDFNINSEGYASQEIDINGMHGLMVDRDDYTVIIWTNEEKHFSLIVTEDKETAIKIARSVTRVN